MTNYSLFVRKASDFTEYGWSCIFDGSATRAQIMRAAKQALDSNYSVRVFKGKEIGRMIYEQLL